MAGAHDMVQLSNPLPKSNAPETKETSAILLEAEVEGGVEVDG